MSFRAPSLCRRLLFQIVGVVILGGVSPLLAQTTGVEETSAPPEPLPVGQVIARVACLHDIAQTYAVYLPSNYAPGRSWPILYAFDASARGQMPVKLFHDVAERLGYIVVGSNNSRNGPFPPIAEAMSAIWRDTHVRFTIDPARVYTTGVSGGNGPALILAARNGAGIIACAGAIDAKQVPALDNRFTWMSVSGVADFNYSANQKLVGDLVALGICARLVSFDGGHTWPPVEIAERALEFIQLSAMRTHRLPVDAVWVERHVAQGRARAKDLLAGGQADGAAEEYAALSRELQGLAPVAEFAAEAARLRDTPEAKKNRGQGKLAAENFEREVAELLGLRRMLERKGRNAILPVARAGARGMAGVGRTQFGDEDNNPEGAETEAGVGVAEELKMRLAHFLSDDKSKKPEVRTLARRVMDNFYVATWQEATARRDDDKAETALLFFEICEWTRPKSAVPVYEQARIHAARGNGKRALATLKQARAKGFVDAARLDADPEWAALRNDAGFREIAEALRAPAATVVPAK